MKVLVSTTGTGIGKNEEERRKTLEGMVNDFVEKVVKLLSPDKIILFYTEESKEMVELIKSKVNIDVECIKITNEDNFNHCFEVMFKTLKEFPSNVLFVNYTYGTKTMSSAMVSAASFVNATLICVAGERKGGIVKIGEVSIFEPYKFKDSMTLERVAKFFNANNFDAAISEAENLIAFDYKSELTDFIKAYKLWDMFKHEEAFENLKRSWKFVDFADKELVNANLEFLGRLLDKIRKNDTVEVYKMKLIDLMENARRRIESGFYDDAVARLYRATELITQILLKLEGYDDPIVLDIYKDRTIFEKFKNFAEMKENVVRLKLGLVNKLELLSELGVDLAVRMKNDSKLRGLLNKRNESILAHGLRPMAEDDAKKFYEHIVDYVAEVYGKHYDKDSKKCRFPKLEVLK